jgi:lysozyme family protein
MAASSYDEALRRLLVHEGGYSNHPSDPGGPTNWGITIHDYRKYVKPNATAADVRGMPVEVAKRIYRSKYWNAMRCDELPAGVDYAVFDYGVNSGIGRAGKVLRRLVGLAGNSGAVTDEVIAAVRRRQPRPLVEAICDERLAFLRRLRTWPVFGNGWGRRVREVRAAALVMAGKSVDTKVAGGKPSPKPAPKPQPGARGKDRTPPAPAAKKFGIGAALVAAVGAVVQWAGEHPLLTGGAVVLAALAVLVVVRRCGKGD